MKLALIFVFIYVAAVIALITFFGGAGHGPGIRLAYYIAWPSSLFTRSGSEDLMVSVGAVQWALIGLCIGAYRKSGAKNIHNGSKQRNGR